MEFVMEFLKDMIEILVRMFNDGWLGIICGLMLVAAILGIIYLVGLGLFVAVDSWLLPRQRGMGRVVGKKFTPAHTQLVMIFNAATKTSMPQPVFYPDTWTVWIEVDGEQDDISVTQEYFNQSSKGDSVSATFVRGRISRKMYLKGISRV
jgi:hypothetical protein